MAIEIAFHSTAGHCCFHIQVHGGRIIFAPYSEFLRAREEASLLRVLRSWDRAGAGKAAAGDRTLVDFASNDYLGLSVHPALIERSCEYARKWGAGSKASRLVRGTLEIHEAIERKVAGRKGYPAAMVFGSGYAANTSVLAALLDKDVLGNAPLVFCDRLNHASIHDGLRLAGVRQIRYRHNDLNHLEHLLNKHRHADGARFIITESVFSMDGDIADIPRLVELAERFGAFIYLDEAHSGGVFGKNGEGFATEYSGMIHAVMGTFSKAYGSSGAYVLCSENLKSYLVNRAGSFIYSTAISPPVLGAIDAALDIVPAMDAERKSLLANARYLREALNAEGIDTAGSMSQIVPAVVGSAGKAAEISRRLEESGFLAPAIRPPTVPAGASRIRFSLSAAHSETEIRDLTGAFIRSLRA